MDATVINDDLEIAYQDLHLKVSEFIES